MQCCQVKHENTHRGIYSMYCPQCNRRFGHRDKLRSHMAAVHGVSDLRIACPQCDKTFTRMDHMRR